MEGRKEGGEGRRSRRGEGGEKRGEAEEERGGDVGVKKEREKMRREGKERTEIETPAVKQFS